VDRPRQPPSCQHTGRDRTDEQPKAQQHFEDAEGDRAGVQPVDRQCGDQHRHRRDHHVQRRGQSDQAPEPDDRPNLGDRVAQTWALSCRDGGTVETGQSA